MVLVHGFGDFGARPLTEAEPLRPPGRTEAALVGAVCDLERQVLQADTASRIEGVVLRYGTLHGAATGSTLAMAAKLRRRRPGEVYNVVDDEPVR